jgi:hypothetical protein
MSPALISSDQAVGEKTKVPPLNICQHSGNNRKAKEAM